jgi:alkylation response protein AidB-like acyl-CoA dehydrogenase
MTVLTSRASCLSPTLTRQDTQSPAVTLDTVVSEVTRRRDEFQRLSHIPRDVIAIMKQAGIFRASTPRRFGGDALPPADFVRILEQIAIADGSAAWVAAFGSANIYLATLPVDTQARLYADGPDQIFAGGLYPMQMAETVPGGYRATGRWRFASGCKGADWLGIGIGVQPEDGGKVRSLIAVRPCDEIEIVDNWNVVGMQGTGSHDLRAENLFIPKDWTCVRGGHSLIDEPLYRYPAVAYQGAVHASINVGLARAALDLAAEMGSGGKGITGAPRLADRAYYKTELARGEAKWRSARAFFYETQEQAWDMLMAGDPVSQEQANLLRLSATWAAHSCAEVVQDAYRIAGMSAIQQTHRMQLLVRDSMVVTQHAILNEGTYESAGALFVGTPPVAAYP